jgi:hypothetical protein
MLETVPDASALIVVEQVKTAKARYEALNALLPGNVQAWTSTFSTVPGKNGLWAAPVAIVTHAMFMTLAGDLQRRTVAPRLPLRGATAQQQTWPRQRRAWARRYQGRQLPDTQAHN